MHTSPYFSLYGHLTEDGIALVNTHLDRVGMPRCSCKRKYRWDVERYVAVLPAFRDREAPPPSDDSDPGYLVVFISCSNCREMRSYSANNIGMTP